jgi:hypothetical protein
MEKLKIKPRLNFKVFDPETQEYLPQEGAIVNRSGYWMSRKEEGSVEFILDQDSESDVESDLESEEN